jgi:branched-chain amino acid transport system substrate-binding protein
MFPGGSPEVGNDQTYLDGMRLAVDEVNRGGGIGGRPIDLRFSDDGGDVDRATPVIEGLLGTHPPAILYVGPGEALPPLRTAFAQAGTPVMLLQGDLYSEAQMFPEAFQTTVPWVWQARVIAKYVVADRHYKRIVFVGSGPEAPAADRAIRDAMTYWGGRLAASYVSTPGKGSNASKSPASKSDAAITFGSPSDIGGEVGAVRTGGHPQVVSSFDLLAPAAGFEPPPAGTTACYTYTWAGWANPIPRVARFVKGFQAMFGHPPVGLEQEGYDAVRALALGLERDGGKGGSTLTSALETIKETSFSSFPIDLGPDDHIFLPRDELGLFAVPGPDERLDPWQHRSDPNLWRPIMRTFTYDGERDNIIEQDRPVFFPDWEKNQPGPYYWESRYGIVSRPKDPLH